MTIKVQLAAAAMVFLCGFSSAPAQEWRQDLADEFDGTDFSAEGGLYYKENFEQSAGTVEFQNEVKFSGTGAVKLSVKPICTEGPDTCSERAELWEIPKFRVPYEQAVWEGFAVKFGDPVPQADHRYLIAQWKREIGPEAEGDFSPFLAFRLKGGKLFITVETNYFDEFTAGPLGQQAQCGPDQTPVWPRKNTNQMRALIVADGSWTAEDGGEFHACTDKIEIINRGNPLPRPDEGWIDFVVLSQPGPTGTGHIEIFANRAWIATVKGNIGHNDHGLGDNQYFKFGPYRAAANDNWSLYYDDFRRSLDCEFVLRDAAACAKIQ
ncbi:MAG: polysaccharide lyase [Albidovulum sp.]